MQIKQARRRARASALQAEYQWLLAGGAAGESSRGMPTAPGFGKADGAHFNALLSGILQNGQSLDRQTAPNLDRAIDALSPVEHAILLIGAYELIHFPDIPYRVVINEAVELGKTFGSAEGYKYVNGVLDKLAARVRGCEKR